MLKSSQSPVTPASVDLTTSSELFGYSVLYGKHTQRLSKKKKTTEKYIIIRYGTGILNGFDSYPVDLRSNGR